MQAISDALERLRGDTSWFARAHELRLLTLHTAGDLRKTALQLLAGVEFHHDNPSPWVVLEDAHLATDAGWIARAHRLAAHWELRRAAFLENEGLSLPPLSLPAGAHFGVVTRAILDALPPPMRGLVLVVAPTVTQDVEALGRELEGMLAQPELEPVRVVWVLDADAPAPLLARRLGARALESRCIADPDAQAADTRALLAGGLRGGAGPAAPPPPRVDDPRPLSPAQRERTLSEAGITPAYLEAAPELATRVLGAALAMKEGHGVDAVRLQREARDLALPLGMPALTVICSVTLATYLSGLGHRPRAVEELDAAIRLAKEHGLALQEAQARLALGLLHALDQRWGRAAHEYAECARRAEASDLGLLAIEGWRLAGQLALTLRNDTQALGCFREAIRVAEASDPAVVKVSSASEAARQLATLCERRGLTAQAASLHASASAMEAGEVGKAAPSPLPDAAPEVR